MRARRAALLAATATLAGSVSLAPPAQASSTVILTATVIDGGGQPVSSAQIALVAWPNADYLDSMADGATVPLRTVQTTTSGSDGKFTLSPDISAIPAMYHEPDGAVNFDLNTAEPNGTNTLTETTVFAAATSSTDPSIATTAEPATMTIDMSNATPSGGGAVGCSPYTATSFRKLGLPEKFMRVFALNSGTATVAETVSSAHSLGIGLRVSTGSTVSWGVAGTASIDTERQAIGTVSYLSNVQIYNRVNYRDFSQNCDWPDSPPGTVRTQRRPTGFSGLQNQDLQTSINPPTGWTDNYVQVCQQVKRDAAGHPTQWTKIDGKNRNFSAGVDIGPISVSSQASYSHQTSETWTATTPELLCGSNPNLGWGGSAEAAILPYPTSCTNGGPCSPARKPQ